MRRSSALLLTLLALTGCASQHRPVGELAVAPAPRTIIAVDVTNPYSRTLDVFYGSVFLGTLAPSAHARYPVPPGTERMPIYGRWNGQARDLQFNISNARTVRYVYEDAAPADR
jgi:hypothetical protein